MAGQKRPTRPVTQTEEAFDGFDAPRWFGPGGTLTSGRLEPGTRSDQADEVPPTPQQEMPPQPEQDAPVDSQATQPVA